MQTLVKRRAIVFYGHCEWALDIKTGMQKQMRLHPKWLVFAGVYVHF